MRLFSVLSLLLCTAAHTPAASSGWIPLLNANLSGWDAWLGAPMESVEGLPPNTPRSPDGHEGQPLGLNNDPKNVFSVKVIEGEPVLHISGEIFGGLTTRASFGNFHFRAQVKWGELTWAPRAGDVRDSGILYHCTGAHGAFWSSWMRSVEFQVQENDMGDLYFLSGTRADVAAVQDGDKWFYAPGAVVNPFGSGPNSKNGSVRHLRGDFENPHGEWNTIEIYAVGRDAVHVVNGKVVLVLTNAANTEGDTILPLDKGQLQIQSEGAEIFYRRIEIRPLSEFPAPLRQAAGL